MSPGLATGTRKLLERGLSRTVPPAETIARAMAIAPAIGITRLANITGLDVLGIPVAQAIRPNARSLSVSQGKGIDLEAARASALMESIELFHAERIVQPLLLASMNELRFSHRLADVESLPRLSIGSFSPDAKRLWIEGVDLLSRAPAWLPYDVVHTNFSLPLPTGSGTFVMSSNGLASGNHPLEALCHGLCEVIERDASTLFHLSPPASQASRQIDLTGIEDEGCRRTVERYRTGGVLVAAWDTTSDLGVPSFFAEAVDDGASAWRFAMATHGAGCHPVREVALLRALTEAAQSRLVLIAGSRDDLSRPAYRRVGAADHLAAVRERVGAPGRRPLRAVPSFPADTLEEDLAWLLARIQQAGLSQVMVVDLTRAEFGVPVVRVVVPGLETVHEAPGFVPGPRARALLASAPATAGGGG